MRRGNSRHMIRGGGGGAVSPSQAHRYWRVYVTANNGSATETDIGEIQLWTGTGGTGTNKGLNANGATWTADSEQVNHAAPTLGDNTVGTGNGWWSANTVLPHWARCDLGAGNVAQIKTLGLINNNLSNQYCPKDFKLQWSDDGAAWTDAITVTGYTGWDSAGNSPVTWNVP